MNTGQKTFYENVNLANDAVSYARKKSAKEESDGRLHKFSCWFHTGDRTPSLIVYPDGGWKCFGCGTCGQDSIRMHKLTMKFSTDWEAACDLARASGVDVPKVSEQKKKELEEDYRKTDILNAMTEHYQKALAKSKRGLEYLTGRGFEEGFALDNFGWTTGNLAEHLIKEKGFDARDVYNTGYVKHTDKGYEDYFPAGWVYIPNIVGGRTVFASVRRTSDIAPKMIHPHGDNEILFNQDAVNFERFSVCEGQFDAKIMEQMGLQACAIYGATTLSKERHAKLFKSAKTVRLCFDGDDEGRKALRASVDVIDPSVSQVLELPDGMDVNEFFLEEGSEALRALLSRSKPFIEWAFGSIDRNSSGVEKSQALEKIMPLLAWLPESEAEAYIDFDLKDKYGIPANTRNAMRKTVAAERRVLSNGHFLAKDSGGDKKVVYDAMPPGTVSTCEGPDGGTEWLQIREGGLTVEDSYELDDEVIKPPPIDKIPFDHLPRTEEVVRWVKEDTDEKLFKDLVETLKFTVVFLSKEALYIIYAAWVFHSHLIDRGYRYSPQMFSFSSEPGHGKTRAFEFLIKCARYGLATTSLRPAYICRITDDWQASIFFDIKNFAKKMYASESEDLVMGRFEAGHREPRTNRPDAGPHMHTDYYHTFAATLSDSNKPLGDIISSRGLSTVQPKVPEELAGRYEDDVPPELSREFNERLTAFRARYMLENGELPEIKKSELGGNRLGDIMKPLWQATELACPEHSETIVEYAKELKGEREADLTDTLEAEVLMALLDLSEAEDKADLADIVRSVNDTDMMEAKGRSRKYHSKTVSGVAETLGFEKKRSSGITWFEIPKKLLNEKLISYGIMDAEDIEGEQE